MSKIASEHLERSAYIYIRQSTPDQVHRNPESRRRQYGLETRARQLGWQEVVVVDEEKQIGQACVHGGKAVAAGFLGERTG